jgi:hypothetical protein
VLGSETWIVLLAGLAGAGVVVGLAVWFRDRGGEPEDVTIGFLGPSLAALYLLVLAVALATEWQTIGDASQAASSEASAVRQLYWSAAGLPSGPANQVRERTIAYADAVVSHDWPQMKQGAVDDQTELMLNSLNTYILRINPPDASATNAQLDAISQLGNVESAREQRADAAAARLPTGLLASVIATSLVVAAFPFVGGIRTSAPSVALAAVQTALVTIGVVVVFQLDHPYNGPLAVTSSSMQSVVSQLTTP